MISKKNLRKIFNRKEYEVELFREKGFERVKCGGCGGYFWTMNPDEKSCGDTGCVGGYKFIDQRINGGWDFHKTIDEWCGFFEQHGHTRIKEYPVVARWRDDIYFTIASIADFQPWVLSGVTKPPANPLVVPQPCVRFGGKGFSDVDNVGKSGRHLSLFVMGGQHSFNSKRLGLEGYWMDHCIELNFKFLTQNLRLRPEEVLYKEDIWIGGGNFGPCLEAFGRGLEIVNNVFMQYEVLPDGSYQKMDFKIIDVGWGIERTCWFTQGTPTIYEATFGPVFNYMLKESGISVDKELLHRYAILSGLIDVEEVGNIEAVRREIASRIGISHRELERELGPLEAIYAIADHMRTFVFALADGAIPSNVGGGYNLRTILRRAMSLNDVYKLGLNLPEICYRHINYLKKSYPRVLNSEDLVDDILDIEANRYHSMLEKGKRHVEGLFKKKEEIDRETLLELYESRGISPEVVKEIAEKRGKHVEIPGDFYVSINERKTEEEIKGEEIAPLEQLKEELEVVKPTRLRYYEELYEKEFKAKVMKIMNGRYVVLDQTLFYPTGGGQTHDTGTLNESRVINVEKIGEIVVHKVDAPRFEEGQEVLGKIDWERRIALMRHHTATHIVNGAARELLGNHIWQAGAEKTPEKARLDITHFKSISKEEIGKIEELSNRIVMENRAVRSAIMERNEAEKKFGFRIYQGGVVPGSELRIVDVDDWDVEACGGQHVTATGEVGVIKIIGAERIQDGIVRLEYSAGESAIKYIQGQENILEDASEILRISKDQLPQTVKKFFKEWKVLKKEVERLGRELAEFEGKRLEESIEKIGDIAFIGKTTRGKSIKELIETAGSLTRDRPDIVVVLCNLADRVSIVVMAGQEAVEKGVDSGEIAKQAAQVVGGKGGGKVDLGQGGGPRIDKVNDALKRASKIIEEKAT
ncbi:MAG: alanine--tRNA ligase [Candidatus Hodarchaeota archaeon]